MQYDPEEILNTMYQIIRTVKDSKNLQSMSIVDFDTWMITLLAINGIHIVPVGSQWALEWKDNAL